MAPRDGAEDVVPCSAKPDVFLRPAYFQRQGVGQGCSLRDPYRECCGKSWQYKSFKSESRTLPVPTTDNLFQKHSGSLMALTTCSVTAFNQMTDLLLRLALTLGADPTLDSSHRVLGQGSQSQTEWRKADVDTCWHNFCICSIILPHLMYFACCHVLPFFGNPAMMNLSRPVLSGHRCFRRLEVLAPLSLEARTLFEWEFSWLRIHWQCRLLKRAVSRRRLAWCCMLFVSQCILKNC